LEEKIIPNLPDFPVVIDSVSYQSVQMNRLPNFWMKKYVMKE